jgi:hypothetical protein
LQVSASPPRGSGRTAGIPWLEPNLEIGFSGCPKTLDPKF